MTENDRMAELSYAYLHAVCAAAGFGCQPSGRVEDSSGVDATIRVNEHLEPSSVLFNFAIEVQLKATKQSLTFQGEGFSYFLQGIDRYDRLREPGSPLPKLLVVLLLPADATQWLTLDEEALIARKCAYWVSLKGAPASDNTSGQTVFLLRSQLLSVEGLRTVASRLSHQEELTYVG